LVIKFVEHKHIKSEYHNTCPACVEREGIRKRFHISQSDAEHPTNARKRFEVSQPPLFSAYNNLEVHA